MALCRQISKLERKAFLTLVINSSERSSLQRHFVAFLRAARFLDPQLADDVEELVEEFGLEFWGAVKIETKEEDPPP